MNCRYTKIGSYNAYRRTPSTEINNCIDDIRINANAMIIEKCHGKEWVLEDSDSQLLAAIEEATLKIIKAVEKWENKNYGSYAYNDVLSTEEVVEATKDHRKG